MLDHGETLAELRGRFPRAGAVDWIGLRPGRGEPVSGVVQVQAVAGRGLAGDRYRSGASGKRQVTLFQIEHLPVIASLLGRQVLGPELLRRNIGVRGLNLLALKERRFQVGDEVVLEMTVPCHPCSQMEEALGPGGYNAVRGHGGICARILRGGWLRLGDRVAPLD